VQTHSEREAGRSVHIAANECEPLYRRDPIRGFAVRPEVTRKTFVPKAQVMQFLMRLILLPPRFREIEAATASFHLPRIYSAPQSHRDSREFVLPNVLFLLGDVVLKPLHKLFDRFVDCLLGFFEVDCLSVVTSPDHLVSMAINDIYN
jgi:hypothetical protein